MKEVIEIQRTLECPHGEWSFFPNDKAKKVMGDTAGFVLRHECEDVEVYRKEFDLKRVYILKGKNAIK